MGRFPYLTVQRHIFDRCNLDRQAGKHINVCISRYHINKMQAKIGELLSPLVSLSSASSAMVVAMSEKDRTGRNEGGLIHSCSTNKWYTKLECSVVISS